MSLVHPGHLGPDVREQLENACSEGSVSFFTSGIDPGFRLEVAASYRDLMSFSEFLDSAADAAVILRELTRATARSLGEVATFTPIRDVAGVGNGVHVHMSFVDDDGDNNGAGTEASPWRTIEWAINNASAGDTVKVLPGTYAYEPAGEQDFPISLPPGVRLMSTGGAAVTTIEGLSDDGDHDHILISAGFRDDICEGEGAQGVLDHQRDRAADGVEPSAQVVAGQEGVHGKAGLPGR